MLLDRQECLEWAFGNLLDNATRGKVAEFIVAKALGIASGHRLEWDDVYLRYGNIDVEVKSSAYLQSWAQTNPSKIVFGVGARRQKWIDATQTFEVFEVPKRLADAYVFCLFHEMDRERANVLDVSQWTFFVAKRTDIDNAIGLQKTASLNTIKMFSHECTFDKLRQTLDDAVR